MTETPGSFPARRPANRRPRAAGGVVVFLAVLLLGATSLRAQVTADDEHVEAQDGADVAADDSGGADEPAGPGTSPEGGGPIGLAWALPFMLLLACIALMPFVHRHWWER